MIKGKKGGSGEISKVLIALIIGVLILAFFFIFLPKMGINIIDFLKNINPFSGEKDNTPAITELEPITGVFPETFEFIRYQGEGKERYTLVDDVRLYFITQSYKIEEKTYYFLAQIDINDECKEIWKSNENKKREESGYTCSSLSWLMKKFTEEFKKQNREGFPENLKVIQLNSAGREEYVSEAELLSLRYYKIIYAKEGGQKEYYLGEIYDNAVPKDLWKTDSSFDIQNKEKLEKEWWGDDRNAARFRAAFIKAQHEI